MRLKQKARSRSLLLLAVLGAGSLWGRPAAAQLRVGQKMPAWSLSDLNGKTVSSQIWKNKPVWITFFHST